MICDYMYRICEDDIIFLIINFLNYLSSFDFNNFFFFTMNRNTRVQIHNKYVYMDGFKNV